MFKHREEKLQSCPASEYGDSADAALLRIFGLLDRLTSVKLEICGSVEDYVSW